METQITGKLFDQGLLGVFVVILMTVIIFLYREKAKDSKDHFVDMKTVWEGDIKFREEVKVLFQNIKDILLTAKK